MSTQKMSISLPKQLYDFVESYRKEHHYKNRSAVINRALYLLQQMQLESCYKAANAEIDDSFEVTTSEGLDDESY